MVELISHLAETIPGFSTAFLHGVMALLTAILTVIFFISFKMGKSPVTKKLTLFFLFFTLYSASVSGSLFFFPGNMQVASWGIIIGLYFIMLVALMGFDTPLFYKHPLFEHHAGRIRILFAMAWGIFSLCGILFSSPSFVGEGNFVYWNLSPVCRWGLAFLCFLAAFGWGYIYWASERYAQDQKTETFIKTRTFTANGMLWAIAGPAYIIAPHFWVMVLAFVIMITTFVVTAGVFSYYRFFHGPTETTTSVV